MSMVEESKGKMRCGSRISFVILEGDKEKRFSMCCSLEREHEGNHMYSDITEVYTENWEDGKYIETVKEEYLGCRKYTLQWENRKNSPGTIESKIQYWRTV